jgi:cobalt-zinc-cadmium efflux system membrane fusion protein
MTDAGSPRRGRRPRSPSTLAWLVALVLAIVILWLAAPRVISMLTPQPPAPPAPPPGSFHATPEQWSTLQFATVEPTTFQDEVTTDGKVATDDDHTTTVFSPVSGSVTRVLVNAGDHVRAGQPLFVVRAAEFIQSQSDLVAAQAGEATAHAQLAVAEATAVRQRQLLKANGAAEKDVQQSEADLASARGAAHTAEANVAAVQNRMRMLGDSANSAALAGRRAPAAAGGEIVVAAPITGVVMSRAIALGQNIASVTNGGAAAAVVISDTTGVWLVGGLRAADAANVKVGDAVEVRLPDLPGRVVQARLDYVAAALDSATHRLAIRARIANADGAMKPEMFGEFTVFTGQARPALAVPEAAVIFEGDTARVWLARADDNLELRQIRAGAMIDGKVEVLSGLKAGDRIVTSGALFIDRAATGD